MPEIYNMRTEWLSQPYDGGDNHHINHWSPFGKLKFILLLFRLVFYLLLERQNAQLRKRKL